MFRVVICILLLFIYMQTVVDQLPRLGKRELVCLLLFTCNYVVSVWRSFLFLWVLGMGYVILLWHSLILPNNYFVYTPFIVIHYLFLAFFVILLKRNMLFTCVTHIKIYMDKLYFVFYVTIMTNFETAAFSGFHFVISCTP